MYPDPVIQRRQVFLLNRSLILLLINNETYLFFYQARVLDEIEDYAQKASVLFDLADEKLLKFLPPPPSVTGPGWQKVDEGGVDQSALIRRASPFVIGSNTGEEEGNDQAGTNRKSRIPTDQAIKSHTKSISAVDGAEALQLYIKALAFLRKGINRAKEYIDRDQSKRYNSESKRDGKPFINNTSPDLNECVFFLVIFLLLLNFIHDAHALDNSCTMVQSKIQ